MYTAVDHLHPWLEPQERLDRLIQTTYRRFGRKVLDLSYANVHDGPDAVVRAALRDAAADAGALCFQYSPYGGRTVTRRAIASRLSEEHALPFGFRDVILTPGAMAALNVALRAMFGPDDEVIVPTPCWHDYPLYLHNLGIPFTFVPLGADKHLDLPAIAAAIGPRTRGLLLSHPCCPTGVLYSRQELEELSSLLRDASRTFGRPIRVIADEVHRALIWTDRPFFSLAASYPHTLCIYSFGKALALQGQRIGYVAISPTMPDVGAVRERLERCVRLMGFCTPTDLMQRAVCRLLDYRPPLDALAGRQTAIRSELRSYGYEICDAEATFFIYVTSPLADEVRFAELLADAGVLVLPSSLFHERGYVRLSVTARLDAIAARLPAFADVLQQVQLGHT
jgi:aspartate aminotransferase